MQDADVISLLTRAQTILDSSELRSELHPAALPKVIDLLNLSASGAAVGAGSTAQPKVTQGPERPVIAPTPASASEAIAMISTRLGLDQALVGHVYALDAGVLSVIVSPKRLSPVRQAAMRELALLVVVGRQSAGLDTEGTPLEVVRLACAGYGDRFYDSKNFMNAIRALADSLRIVGDAKDAVKVNPGGYEAATELITTLMTKAAKA